MKYEGGTFCVSPFFGEVTCLKKLKITVTGLFVIVLIVYLTCIYMDSATTKHDAPLIQFDSESIIVSVDDDDSVLLEGVSATDAQDGDVTSSLIVEEKTRFIAENTRTVSYVAFDSDHNACRLTRKMVYSDYQLPSLNLTGPLIFASIANNFDPNGRIESSSVLDGDISSKVRVLNSKDYIIGHNPVEIKVNDSAGGESSLKVKCTINEAYHPDVLDIQLSEYLVYLEKGTRFRPRDYLSDVLLRGQSHPELIRYVECSDVSLDETGVYEVDYYLKNGDDEAFSRLVIVVEE